MKQLARSNSLENRGATTDPNNQLYSALGSETGGQEQTKNHMLLMSRRKNKRT